MAAAIRGALDMLLDGQHTGHYRWDQLHKTEKTHAGTLVEIALARTLRLADGVIAGLHDRGADVDCKFSHGGGWMIPPEADGKLLLLVQASDEDGPGRGLIQRHRGEPAPGAPGRQARAQRARPRGVRWLQRAPLQERRWQIAERDGIFALPTQSGCLPGAQRMRVSRTAWPRSRCRTTT